jgi:AcrR family transcriptional regulator
VTPSDATAGTARSRRDVERAVTTAKAPRARRPYDNTLRRQRATQTRERIIAAGAELVRGSSIRDWHGVTMRAVAGRAEVNERTVYRHFANERALRDAVMHHMELQAGIDLRRMTLDDIADVTARIFDALSSQRLEPRAPLDATLVEAKQRQHDALSAAIAEEAPRWPVADRTLAAATFDLLWSVASYERLVLDWDLDHDEASRSIAWVMNLVAHAVRAGRRPPSAESAHVRRSGTQGRRGFKH